MSLTSFSRVSPERISTMSGKLAVSLLLPSKCGLVAIATLWANTLVQVELQMW